MTRLLQQASQHWHADLAVAFSSSRALLHSSELFTSLRPFHLLPDACLHYLQVRLQNYQQVAGWLWFRERPDEADGR